MWDVSLKQPKSASRWANDRHIKRLDRLTDGGLELHLNMKIPPLQDVLHLETEQGSGPQSESDHEHPEMFSFIQKQTNLHQYHSE